MGLGGKAAVQVAQPKVRFFVGDRQIFAKETGLQFQSGDVLDLFGRRYRVLDSTPVFNLEDESVITDVRLSDALVQVQAAQAVEEN